MESQNTLSFAARGYIYQDMAVAYLLATALFNEAEKVIVDSKEYKGDIFDDLTIVKGSFKIRRQFKSSADTNRRFTDKDLKTTTNKLRIDDVIDCWNKAGKNPADEYRICSTWLPPDTPDFVDKLIEIECSSSFDGHRTKCFRLDPEKLWPNGKDFLWKLEERANGIKNFSREQLFNFCDRLVIELDCPQISIDWQNPGALEALLLNYLKERIGVGRPPNEKRDLVDVATRLVLRANQARAKGETISPQTLLYDLNLRSDYGRLPQEFPVISELFVERPELHKLKNALDDGNKRIAIAGPPGSGKSWFLTKTADFLRETNNVVIQHYCYIEPHDKFRTERVTIKALYANLTASLLEQLPALREQSDTLLGASRKDFERLLQSIPPNIKVIIIVDGLDHISRIAANDSKLSLEQTSILFELATLPLPENALLIVGSQPLADLADLALDTTLSMRPWTERDGLMLLKKMRFLDPFFKGTQMHSARFLKALLNQSEGNPLYLHYLATQMAGYPVEETLFKILAEVPILNGDLNRYYSYLFQNNAPNILARVLSAVDFSMSEKDFVEIFPYLVAEIPDWTKQLKPVLSLTTTQGGYRIYHDSFRQYVIDECKRLNISVTETLRPLIEWLRKLDFFRDTRSYNHLLRLLHIAGQNKEALELLSDTFVSKSLQWLHSENSIRNNLSLGAEIAANEFDWLAMARFSELHRILHTTFEAHLQNILLYAKAFAAINGYNALAQRLLYEGHPCFDTATGFSLCVLCDDNGVIPPWKEYFNIEDQCDQDDEQTSLNMFHGFCRESPENKVFQNLLSYLLTGRPRREYLHALLNMAAKFFGRKFLYRLSANIPVSNQIVTFEICLILSKTYSRNSKNRRFYANAALHYSNTVQEAREAVLSGATVLSWAQVKPLGVLLDVVNSPQRLEPEFVAEWCDSVRILAHLAPRKLVQARKYIKVRGWYQAWMRYFIDLALATKLSKKYPRKAERKILIALNRLSNFSNPHAGPIRSMDLLPIRRWIKESITNTLRILVSEKSFLKAQVQFQQMVKELVGWVWSVPMGPFALDDIVDCIFQVVRKKRLSGSVLQQVASLISEENKSGYFYQTQSEMSMKLAIAHALSGNRLLADEQWKLACSYLCGYGERKDRTIFEIIEGFPTCDVISGIKLIESMRPLVARMDHFTDGKGTRNAIIVLFEQLHAIDRSAAGLLLIQTIISRGCESWRLKACFKHLLLESSSEVNPLLGFYALSHCVDYVDSLDETKKSLILLERLAKLRPELISQTFNNLVRWPSSLHFGQEKEMYSELVSFATKYNIEIPDRLQEKPYDYGSLPQPDAKHPIFSQKPTVTEMIRSLREYSARTYDKRPNELRLLNTIFFKALELTANGDEASALRLLNFFRDNYYISEMGSAMEGLAEGFLRYGHKQLAAALFVNAYMTSRGGGGWLSLGDEHHFYLLEKAQALFPETTKKELFDRIKDTLSRPGYIMGLTQYLIVLAEKFESTEISLCCWNEAFRVISGRLISSETTSGLFEGPIEAASDWSIDELFIGLLFSIAEIKVETYEFIFLSLPEQAIRPLIRVYSMLSNSKKIEILTALVQVTPFAQNMADKLKMELEISAELGGQLSTLSQQVLDRLTINGLLDK